MKSVKLIIVTFFLFFCDVLFSQIYPVQLSAQLIPPYSGYLPDYADPSSEKLKVILQFNDFTTPQYNIRLKIEIKGNGFTLVTKQLFNPPPLTLQSGVPLLLSGTDLAPYLNSNNLDFIGINQSQYEQRMALPEGYYSICVKAYDYYNPGNIQVSNESCSQAWFMLSDPPFLNLPQCGKNITPLTPQNILFQWTPMNMSSPNSAANTEYEFALWEVRPDSSANPNQIVLSTAPIFSTTTNLTTLNYGITEPSLNLYMKYVWRVRARDITGRDWFKNNGNSQIYTFVYGSLQTVLGNALNLTLSAQGITHRLGKCTWNTQSLYTKYLLQVRKTGTQNWFDYYCTNGFEKVNNLEPNTSYEARVRGEGTVTSDWSNIATFNTTPEPNYSCNDQTQYADVLAAQPLPPERAMTGLIIQTGQFEVIATQIYPSGPPGWYSGKGYAKVFGALPLAVQFNNIYIDDNNRHQQGVIQALTQGINNWVNQWDVKDAEENATYINGVDSVYVNGNQVCVKIQGKISDSCFAFPPNQNVIVVRDDQGNQWTVSVNPPPPTVTGPTNYYQISNDELDAGDSTLVVFKASPAQQYGFDEKKYTAWTNNYELIKLKNGKNYFVPYKSVKEFGNDEVYAEIDIKDFVESKLTFKTDNSFELTKTKVDNGTYKLNVPYQYKSVYAWYNGKKIGKLNVVSLKSIAKKLLIVPVGNASINTGSLQGDLNNIYSQANVTWSVAVKSAFSFNLGNDGLKSADATLMSKYSEEMRALRDAYKQATPDYDKEAYYVFVVSSFDEPSLKGYMVRGRALGFVATTGLANETSRLIAHELAHGAFGLEHTFPAITKSTSQNLMDYGTGTELSKVQWEEMQNPGIIINWLDEEEDASMSSTDFEKWLKALYGIDCYNTYKNYDGVIPQCAWNNNLNMTSVDAYGRALVCGIIDGAFITIKDAVSLTQLIECWGISSYLPSCIEVQNKSVETIKTIKEICTTPGAHKKIYDALIVAGAEWDLRTFCNDITCAYSQGRAIFDIVSLFYGVGEAKAALSAGVAGAKIVEIIKAFDQVGIKIINAFSKVGRKLKVSSVGIALCVKLSTNYEFDIGKLDALKKAIKFNNSEISASISGSSLGKLEGVQYIDNGVVKVGDIEIVEFTNPVDNSKVAGWRKFSYVNKVYKNVSFEDFTKTVSDFAGGAKKEIAEQAFKLWGENRWGELYKLFKENNLNNYNGINWPPFNGAKSVFKVENGNELSGKIFDRFQETDDLTGGFASPVKGVEGVNELVYTYDSRALANSIKEGTRYIKFKMKNNLPNDLNFEYGEAIPWFNLLGNADQIKSSRKFDNLFENGYIEILEVLKRENGKWKKIK